MQKKIIPGGGVIFVDKGVIFVELGSFDKDFVKNTRKRAPTWKYFGVFSPRYSEKHILEGKFNPKMNQGFFMDWKLQTEKIYFESLLQQSFATSSKSLAFSYICATSEGSGFSRNFALSDIYKN